MISIKIPFSGKPDPVITWQKGQDLIDNNGYYQVIVTRSFTSLVFSNGVERKDAGFYIVCAKNRFGIDQQTVELDVADVPDPPRGVKASDVSRDSVTLNWCAPASDGGSKVTSYIVEKCATTAEKWMRVAQARDTHYTVINLFGKTSYQFRVIAENKFGQSEPSDPTSPVVTKEDKSRVLNYDEEVDDITEVSTSKAPNSEMKNLYNKYMIAEELGRGNFGIVHRCIEISSEKTFMVKFVKVKGADQAIVKKEIATLNLSRHKNFLCLHESFESPEELVMIYDFISGVDIFERIASPDFELTERVIVKYIKQVCEALTFLHSKSFGHFDIKPENIIYTTRKGTNIKIIEMGQARHLTPGDSVKIQFTTPEYCAPEIHQHDLVSTVTDMWSVGVLAYVLISGLNPFTAETNQQVIDNISNAEYSFDDEAFKKVRLDALDFVDRLLTKDRKHRMTAAEALEHPWLTTEPEQLSNTAIKTTRHTRYYQTVVKKEWNVVVSAARVANGGAIRSQRGVTVSKAKIAPFEHGPVASQIKHNITEEGGDAKFVCHIENYDSSTEVTWYCGVRQLEENDKYEISYEDGLAILSVRGVNRADDGTYRCKAVNECGEDSAYAELFVQGLRSYQDYFFARPVKKVKRRVDTTRLLQKPPEFTFPLISQSAHIAENVRFGVTITVHPEPRVLWLKSGQKITPGDDDRKYIFTSDKGLYQLVIRNIEPEDDAEYTVVARNRFGEDSCKARLTVTPRPSPADSTIRPMFKRVLANVECREGQSVRFEVRVSGSPILKWEKDGTSLSFGPQIEVIHEGLDYYVLHVRDTLPEDSGTYRVTATNSAGSASCQATLRVERVAHVKKEYESEAEKKERVQKLEIDKKVRLSQILSGTEVTPLTPVAQQALREAATMYKPALTKKDKVEMEDKKEKEERKKRAEEKRLRMPYDVPQPRVRAATALEQDNEIKYFVPLSDMKWYKILRDQYEMPEPMEKHPQKRPKRIRLSRWDKFYEVPQPRIKTFYKSRHIPKTSQDDIETVRPARYRAPSPESEAFYRPRRRSLGDLSDEELLLPVRDYLSMKKTEEERLRLEDELQLGFSASPPSLSPVRFELSPLRHTPPKRRVYDEEEEEEEVKLYDSYRIPSKFEAGPSFIDLHQRYERITYRPPKQKQRLHAEREDHEILCPVATTQKLSAYQSELKRIEAEEKTRGLKKEQRVQVSSVISEGGEASITPSVFTPEARPVFVPRRRSPTPEEAPICPPSPVVSDSIQLTGVEGHVDIMSRYEARKAALKSERKYEVVTQQPFSLDHAPRVTVRMRSHRVPVGQNSKFTLNVQAKPDSEFKWYHNGQEIHEGKKFQFNNICGVLSLHIFDCQAEDSGTYRVVCRNVKGEASDYATLDVSGVGFTTISSLRKEEEPPTPYIPEMTRTDVSFLKAASTSETHMEVTEVHEHIQYEECKSAEKTEVTTVKERTVCEEMLVEAVEVTAVQEIIVQEEVKTTLPARILVKPQSLTVSEGENAKFTCDFDGDPTPSVTWAREGQVIVSKHRHHVSTTDNKSTLDISSVDTLDEGSYTVLVENSEGQQEAQFSLTVRKATPKETAIASPPKVKSPEPRVKSPFAKSPEPRIRSPIGIKSPPKVKSPEPRVKSPVSPGAKSPELQGKSPTEMKLSPMVKSVESRLKSTLSPEPCIKSPMLKSPEPRVTSPVSPGSKTPESRIKSPEAIQFFKGSRSPEPTGSPQRVKSPLGVKSPTPRKASVTKPDFSIGLSDVTAHPDTIVKLTVKATGDPAPEFSWIKGNQVK